MDTLFSLRRFVYDLRRKYLKGPVKPESPVLFSAGLPAGVDTSVLQAICLDHFNEKPVSFSYQHLSGWKPVGAFRLLIKTQTGKEIPLIYKNAYYSHDQIPALIDLPIHPGPPEYAVYNQPTEALQAYLPEIYLVEEVKPGLHYRYIMEDLNRKYRRIIEKEDILRISGILHGLHEALSDWTAVTNERNLLRYGRDFSHALQEYTRANLEAYSHYTDDACLKTILSQWSRIAEMHLQPEFFNSPHKVAIHGDTNYTNFRIDRQDPYKFKIIDWEWAGFGLPYADLASLVKGAPDEIKKQAYGKFTGLNGHGDPNLHLSSVPKENQRLFLWCQLERGLLDAGFLAAQEMNSAYQTGFSLPKAITQSLQRVLSAYQQLLD